MTREEIIQGLRDIDTCQIWESEVLDEAIKALEQEPTTKNNLVVDCISRQAVLNLPRKQLKNYFGEVTGEVIDVKDIMDMPSVTPKIEPRKGHWIVAKGGSYLGKRNACCSSCKDFYTNDWRYMNYCPNCGADMRESEEV